MNNRTLSGAIIAGLAMAICSSAETCREALLYDGSLFNGQMENTTRTFPEAPEWKANWGNFDKMNSPYIRLSGIKGQKGDWTGNLVFDGMPITLAGGSIQLSVRATQDARFGVWLSGNSGTGNITFYNLKANTTELIEAPAASFIKDGNAMVSKVGVGLFNVPANQYTTLFIDNVKFTCAKGDSPVQVNSGDSDVTPYHFRNVDISSPVREFFTPGIGNPKAAIQERERESLQQRTTRKFVLDEQEHRQVTASLESQGKTARQSRDGWYKSMFIVERNRIADNIIASSKNLFREAGEIAAASGNTTIPLLIADIDYAIKRFTDSTFTDYRLEDYHLLLAGFAVSEVRSSKVNIVFDPFFVTTTRGILPGVEICTAGKCQNLDAGKETTLEFASAGEQAITVKLRSGNTSAQQVLKLEVK